MRIKLFGHPAEMDAAVNALRTGFVVASVGRQIKTRNAGRPDEVAVNVRAAVRRQEVAS